MSLPLCLDDFSFVTSLQIKLYETSLPKQYWPLWVLWDFMDPSESVDNFYKSASGVIGILWNLYLNLKRTGIFLKSTLSTTKD